MHTSASIAMTSNTPVSDLSPEEMRAQLVLLGYEKEALHPSMDDSALSRLLTNVRANPRNVYVGLLILSFKETVEMLRPHLVGLDISEKYVSTATAVSSQSEEITFTRLSEHDAQGKLSLPKEADRVLKCPRCDAAMHMYYKRNSSDGYCGIQYANHICTDLTCGLNIERYYEGYGSIFD